MMQLVYAAFLIATLSISTRAEAIIRCEMNGKPVNSNNGAETAGLTGLLRCREEDTGRLQREQELRDGKYLGVERFFDREGKLTRERSVNERGNSQGPVREFWPNGQVKLEEVAENGETRGVVRTFAQSGKPQRVSFVQDRQTVFSLEYNEQGQINRLQCPATSVMAEDRKPCGFEGRADAVLFGNKGEKSGQRTFDKGRLLEAINWQTDGSLASQQLFDGGRRVHRNYSAQGNSTSKAVLREERVFEDDDSVLNSTRGKLQSLKLWGSNGQIIEYRRYTEGREVALERWYLNGAIKERAITSATGAEARLLRESFNDAGVMTRREQLMASGREYERNYTGPQQAFHDNGKLAFEDTWSAPDERGRTRLIARKHWDESGRLIADDEILEDGSRKRKAGSVGS
ncbi:MAG TPA: hypothetical protein PK497_05925 [Burkholderiaceae bacterium]|nr:hypothetical protein [Burkholderiaceae bacterium]